MQREEGLGDMVIGWGSIYDRVISTFQNAVGEYAGKSPVDFERINEAGEHDPDEYYYVYLSGIFLDR